MLPSLLLCTSCKLDSGDKRKQRSTLSLAERARVVGVADRLKPTDGLEKKELHAVQKRNHQIVDRAEKAALKQSTLAF